MLSLAGTFTQHRCCFFLEGGCETNPQEVPLRFLVRSLPGPIYTYIYIYTYMYIYIYMYTYVCVYIYIYIYLYLLI